MAAENRDKVYSCEATPSLPNCGQKLRFTIFSLTTDTMPGGCTPIYFLYGRQGIIFRVLCLNRVYNFTPHPSPHPPIPYSHLERTHSRRSISHRKKLITYFQPLRTLTFQTVPPLHVSRPAPPPPSPQCTNAYVLRPLTSECTPSSLWLKETGLYNFQGPLSGKFPCSTPPGTVPHHWHTRPSDQWGARITRYNWCARW